MKTKETPQKAVERIKKNVHTALKESPLEKVVDEIIDLMPRLNTEVHDINSGGCGVFSYLLWKKLIELGYTDIEVVPYLNVTPWDKTSPYDLDKVQKNFMDVANGNADFEVPWNHIILALLDRKNNQSIIIDSESVSLSNSVEISGRMADSFHEIGNPISFEVLEKLLDVPGWNDTFDRNQIPLLKDILATLA